MCVPTPASELLDYLLHRQLVSAILSSETERLSAAFPNQSIISRCEHLQILALLCMAKFYGWEYIH